MIQNAAKNGYSKVWLPTGNTSAKVEGHTTLEEFKKQKEDRIKELENKGIKDIPFEQVTEFTQGSRIYKKVNGEWKLTIDGQSIPLISEDYTYNPEKDYNDSGVKELQQLKQELERVEREGFGALKPIYKFYEETVTNILKKQGYNPTLITDEYGNTWNEVIIDNKSLSKISLNLSKKQQLENLPNDKWFRKVIQPVINRFSKMFPNIRVNVISINEIPKRFKLKLMI